MDDLRKADPERNAEIVIADHLSADGDMYLLRIALVNLLGNAWKYSGKQSQTRIEFGSALLPGQSEEAFYVSDNGVGFDMKHASSLFKPFERLHSEPEFAGSGIGLATVQRILRRHDGRVWAEGRLGKGAIFYFALPVSKKLVV